MKARVTVSPALQGPQARRGQSPSSVHAKGLSGAWPRGPGVRGEALGDGVASGVDELPELWGSPEGVPWHAANSGSSSDSGQRMAHGVAWVRGGQLRHDARTTGRWCSCPATRPPARSAPPPRGADRRVATSRALAGAARLRRTPCPPVDRGGLPKSSPTRNQMSGSAAHRGPHAAPRRRVRRAGTAPAPILRR